MRWIVETSESRNPEIYESVRLLPGDRTRHRAFAQTVIDLIREEGLYRPDLIADPDISVGHMTDRITKTLRAEQAGSPTRQYHVIETRSGPKSETVAVASTGRLMAGDYISPTRRVARGITRRIAPGNAPSPLVTDEEGRPIQAVFEFGVNPHYELDPDRQLILGGLAYQAALDSLNPDLLVQFTVHKKPENNIEQALVQALKAPAVALRGMRRGFRMHRLPVAEARENLGQLLSDQGVKQTA